jgi:PAS domain S-box-containing protein
MESTFPSIVGTILAIHAAELLGSTLALGMLVLVERRGRNKPMDPKRQVELHTLLESLPDAVMIVDAAGLVVDVNGAVEKISGLSRSSQIGMKVSEFAKFLSGEANAKVVSFKKPIAMRALAGEHVSEERRRIRHPKSGDEMELLVSANPIFNEKGEVRGALILARDVTELTRLEQRLADIERHQAIGHVAAGLAHDFNNTLQTISQAAAVLQMEPERPFEERKVFLEMIQNAVRRGAEVIARIRDYLRSGSAATSVVNIRNVIEEAIELTRPMWKSRNVAVHREIHECGSANGNKADILRVLTNLIINGLQAMGQGGELWIGCENEANVVHAWVRDNGHGIPPELSKRIFIPYFTTKAGGTGLGLSGAQKIMLELGGNISFSSDPGNCTQFDLRFPTQKEQQDHKLA